MMKTLLAASVAMLALGAGAGAAQAQDVLPNGPWSGVYAGVHGGGLFDERIVSTVGTAAGNSANVFNLARPAGVFLERDGGALGGQLGFNVQRGNLVGGVEVDASYLNSKGTTRYASPTTFGAALTGTQSTFQQSMNYLASARLRVGVAGERIFMYGTGGISTGEVTDRVRFANSPGALQFVGEKTSNLPGFAVGAGVEYALAPTINYFHMRGPTVRVEYLHYNLGDKTISVPAVAGVGANGYAATFHNTADVIRGAINVKF